MDNKQFARTINFIGEEAFSLISQKRIAIIGLGGVGGTALEALARSGFCHFLLVDCDVVEISNLNRQILYTLSDVGLDKVNAAKKRILAINKEASINVQKVKISAQNCTILDDFAPDFIVDAIDDIPGKVALSCYAVKHHISIIVSLGMAKRIDPTQISIMRLDKTTDDPLAKKFRHEIKASGCQSNDIMTVVSKETPSSSGTDLPSLMMVPSSAGLSMAYYVLSYFLK